jgi:hypothetical protein
MEVNVDELNWGGGCMNEKHALATRDLGTISAFA